MPPVNQIPERKMECFSATDPLGGTQKKTTNLLDNIAPLNTEDSSTKKPAYPGHANADLFTLQLLQYELVDPQEELYVQQSKDLASFLLFPKFPFEIRLKIWRLAFSPPRTLQPIEFENVSFVYYRRRIDEPGPEFVRMANYTNNLPVTLSINHESREETLKHDILVTRESFKMKPLFFAPDIDVLSIRGDDLLGRLIRFTQFRYDYKTMFPATAISRILVLHISCGAWLTHNYFDGVREMCDASLHPLEHHDLNHYNSHFCLLGRYSALKVIHCTIYGWNREERLRLAEWTGDFKKRLESHKDLFTSGVAPELVVIDGHKD